MANIILFDNSIIEKLPASARKYMIARQGNKIMDMNGDEMLQFATTIYDKSYKFLFGPNAGSKIESDDKQMELVEFITMLRGNPKYKKLTKQEIGWAIKNGVQGLYKEKPDETIIISRASFKKWIDLFMTKERWDSYEEYKRLTSAPEEKVIPSTEEQLKIKKSIVIDLWLKFMQGNEVYDYSGTAYDNLKEWGFLSLTEERWQEIYKQAETKEKAYNKQINDLNSIQDAIKNGYSFQARCTLCAKNMAILEYFKFCKEQELNLNEEIEKI